MLELSLCCRRNISTEFFFRLYVKLKGLLQIYSCPNSFFLNCLNWLMSEQSGYINTEHKTWTLSNFGIKTVIWGLWLWRQNSSLDFRFFFSPHFSQIFSSYNPGAAVFVLSPVGDWLLMSSGVRFTAVWTRTPTLPWNRRTSGAEASTQRPLDTVGLNSRRLQRDFQRLWIVVGGGDRCAVMMWARVSPTPSDWSAASTFDLAKFPLKLRVNDKKLRLPAASECEEKSVSVWEVTEMPPKKPYRWMDNVSVKQLFTPVVVWFVSRITQGKSLV